MIDPELKAEIQALIDAGDMQEAYTLCEDNSIANPGQIFPEFAPTPHSGSCGCGDHSEAEE